VPRAKATYAAEPTQRQTWRRTYVGLLEAPRAARPGSTGTHRSPWPSYLATIDIGQYSQIPDDDPFWAFVIGEPPHDDLFGDPVYLRGGMTLQVLRNRVGDDTFFDIAKAWVPEQGGGTGTTEPFIALSERISGQQLDDLFDAWLFTGSKPTVTTLAARTAGSTNASARTTSAEATSAASAVHTWDSQFTARLARGRY
jgi:hypothetical protein